MRQDPERGEHLGRGTAGRCRPAPWSAPRGAHPGGVGREDQSRSGEHEHDRLPEAYRWRGRRAAPPVTGLPTPVAGRLAAAAGASVGAGSAGAAPRRRGRGQDRAEQRGEDAHAPAGPRRLGRIGRGRRAAARSSSKPVKPLPRRPRSARRRRNRAEPRRPRRRAVGDEAFRLRVRGRGRDDPHGSPSMSRARPRSTGGRMRLTRAGPRGARVSPVRGRGRRRAADHRGPARRASSQTAIRPIPPEARQPEAEGPARPARDRGCPPCQACRR